MNKAPNVLGLNMIRNDELGVWLNVLSHDHTNEEGEVIKAITQPEKMLNYLTLINDLLILQKNQCLMTRKRGLKDQLEARIAKELGLPFKNMNVRKR